MDNLSDDIIKYKRGELSAERMHALEKKALSDPFLADALEGIETIPSSDLEDDVAAINKKMQIGKRRILFTPLRIAAGLGIISLSLFVIYQFLPQPEEIAMTTQKPKSEVTPAPEEVYKDNAQKEVDKKEVKKLPEARRERKAKEVSTEPPKSATLRTDQRIAAAESTTQASGKLPAAHQPLQEVVVVADSTSKPHVTGQGLTQVDDSKNAGIEKESLSRAKMLRKADAAPVVSLSQRGAAPKIQNDRFISGNVTNAEDNTPLPGVNVVLKGTTEGTVTNASGGYKIRVDSTTSELVFSFIGFQSAEVNAAGKGDVNVTLKTDVSQLSEIVVTGVGTRRDDGEPVVKWAEPEGGRKAYDNYLESSVQYPEEALANKVKGKAGIEFTVGLDGSLSDFRVFKKLGYGCEQEMIRLVKAGPKWSASTEDNKPFESIVRVRMRFDAAKRGK